MSRVRRPTLVAALIVCASLMQPASASLVAADDAPQGTILATVEPPHTLIVPGPKSAVERATDSRLCTKPRSAPELARVPPYPALAKAFSQEGFVELRFMVEADGSVAQEGLQITRSSGFPLLDEAAVLHMSGQRFVPANCSGVAVRSAHAFRVRYTLDDATDPDSCQRPTNVAGLPQQPPYPAGAKARGEEGDVRLAFIADLDGSVMARGLTIVQSSGHAELDAAAVLFILQHRFNPAQCDGKPTSSAHYFEVKFELPKPQK